MTEENALEFRDALFRTKKKKSGYRLVLAPCLEASVADTHAHLDMLSDVPLNLARCAVHRVSFIGSIVDMHEDTGKAYHLQDVWRTEALKILPDVIAETERVLADAAQASEDAGRMPDTVDEPADVPHIRVIAGCHPHNAKFYDDDLERKLIERLRDPRTAAVGEVGLDYHYDFSPREQQREAFRRQIRLSHESGLPLVLHLREAHDEALEIMDEEGFPSAGTLLHCFNLDEVTLEPWLSRGCLAAFGGSLTFKKSEDTRIAASHMARNRIVTETDAPYMAPEPMRGMPCGPEHTIFTAARLADVCGCRPGEERREFLETIYANALSLLDREPTAWQRESGIVEADRQDGV